MHETWGDIALRDAIKPEVWGYIVSRLIEDQQIEPYYLMASGKIGKQGLEAIDFALNLTQGDLRDTEIDNCVRSVSASSLFFTRIPGNRSILRIALPPEFGGSGILQCRLERLSAGLSSHTRDLLQKVNMGSTFREDGFQSVLYSEKKIFSMALSGFFSSSRKGVICL